MRNRKLDAMRREATELENHYIDEYEAGHIDRAELFKRGAAVGMAMPLLGMLGRGAEAMAATRAPARRAAGGTLRVGNLKPASAIDPITSGTQATLESTSISGEYLIYLNWSGTAVRLVPALATSWKPDKTARVWTFVLRSGVTFSDGSAMTADDVVATFDRLTDPANGSQALSAYKGVLSKGGTKKIDDHTVRFTLDAPTPSFPYLVCSTTYQAVILPKDYQVGSYEKSNFPGTGPYKLTSYLQGVRASFVRNDKWWGGKAPFDAVTLIYFNDTASEVAALQQGQLDVVPQFAYQEGRPLYNNSKYRVYSTRSSVHRQIPMRVDTAPLKDPRAREAIGLLLNRPDIVKRLFGGRSDLGNDSPFAPVQTTYPKSVPQRHQDVAKARQLLAAAGVKKAHITITTEQAFEIPDLAQLIQSSLKPAGISVSLKILSVTKYYSGKQAFGPGDTPWLNAPVTITDWGPRAVPNVLLTSAFRSDGIWNAAHYKNKALDKLINSFNTELDLASQRKTAAAIQTILLKDTPVLVPYFYNYLAASTSKLKGYYGDPMGLIFLPGVTF